MKVMNIENPQEFLKVIDSCSGQVELVTADGDLPESEIKIMPAGILIYHF